MSQKNTFLKIIVPVIVVAAGAAVMTGLSLTRTEPKKEIRKDLGVLVRTVEAAKQDVKIIVKGSGTVKASQEVTVIPQVSGRITFLSPDMVVGGHFKKDDLLFKIEDVDYVLGLEQAKAARAKAEYDLATIESRADIARSEWERLNLDDQTEPNPLVLYGPQLANARAALASSNAAVEQSRLALERTIIKAPFNVRVKSESLDIGQYVKSGNSIAVLAGTDTVEINVPLPPEDLHWLNIPLHGRKLNGPDALVSVNIGGQTYEWQGHILRSTGEVDPKSRMMQVVIEVRDPYGLTNKTGTAHPALTVGTFVDVRISGRMLNGVFMIPRAALRDNSTVWIMEKDNKLRIKNVTPLRLEKETVILSRGLADGDRLVLTNISGAANGMKLRVMK
jgi:RND family efflux transporter MFP subunit